MVLSEGKQPLMSKAALAFPALSLGIGAFMLFYNAFRFSLPLGYAGLYAQASRQIALSNFRLPLEVHFYGPGDLPFAYPPLAFYAMAAFLDLGISPLTYLRFIPPLLSFLSLILLYLLGLRLTHSRLGAAAAVGLSAASPALYMAHTWAAGVVRALAFLFLLAGLYLFDRAVRQDRPISPIFAGISFGLVVLTHLSYAWFLALCFLCWLVTNPNRQAMKAAAFSAGVGILIVAPWGYVMLSRYGTAPFLSALSTHGNGAFLAAATQPRALAAWVAYNLRVITAVPFLILLVALGLALLLALREFTLPLLFGLSVLLLSPEGDRFIIVVAALLAGASAGAAAAWLSRFPWADTANRLVLGLVVIYGMVLGFRAIRDSRPQLQDGALDLGRYVQSTTSAGTRYVMLAAPNEAEWFPFLLQREPLASKWGAEWLGTYYSASGLVAAINDCRRTEDVVCLQNLNLNLESQDILITHKNDKGLSVGLESQPGCPQLAVIGQYVVWKVGCLLNNTAAQVMP